MELTFTGLDLFTFCRTARFFGEGIRASHLLGHADNGVIYLNGPVGVGKTTWSQHMMREMGVEGPIKSPTYQIVEEYERISLNHFDFYRMGTPESLIDFDIEHYFYANRVSLIEWPDHAKGVIPKPDLVLELSYNSDNSDLRDIVITTKSKTGSACMNCFNFYRERESSVSE